MEMRELVLSWMMSEGPTFRKVFYRTFIFIFFCQISAHQPALADTRSGEVRRAAALGYSNGMVDAIRVFAPLFDDESSQLWEGAESAEFEKYLIFLVDQFYLHVHANYSHKESGIMVQLIMEKYYGVFQDVLSADGKDSFEKLISLDEKAARNAKREIEGGKDGSQE